MDIPRILFVSMTRQTEQLYLDPSVRYRCFNFAEDIRVLGGIADVISPQKFEKEMIDYYDYFIFHRPWNGDNKLGLILKEIRSQHKSFHADYDDLIFAVKYALESSIFLNGRASKHDTIKIFKKNFNAFQLFDHFTVSTDLLAEQIVRLNPKAMVNVIPNGLSRSLLKSLGLFDEKQHTAKKAVSPRQVISYFPGTKSHDCDFAYIKDVLIKFFKRHRNFYLFIAGLLDCNEKQFPSGSIFLQEHKPYRDFFKSAANAHINIAPLVPNNIFNGCKSSLKFFESGVWGVPTIASPIGDYNRFADSKGLMLPSTLDEWEYCLELLTDAKEYENATNGLQEYCINRCLSSNSTHLLIKTMNNGRESKL